MFFKQVKEDQLYDPDIPLWVYEKGMINIPDTFTPFPRAKKWNPVSYLPEVTFF